MNLKQRLKKMAINNEDIRIRATPFERTRNITLKKTIYIEHLPTKLTASGADFLIALKQLEHNVLEWERKKNPHANLTGIIE